MFQTTVRIDGMMCGMCESHINDAVRQNFSVKKVSSSHTKNETVIISEEEIDTAKLEEVIAATGYTFVSAQVSPYEKKGFSLFGRKK